jgi:hypothetical protein
MSRTNIRWLATVGVAGAVALGATLGVAGAAGAAGATSTRARTTTHAAGRVATTSFNFSVAVNGLTVTGSGHADFKNDSVSLSVDVPAVVAKLIPGGSASPEVINAVEIGGTVYLEVPSLASTVGKPWISVALPAKAKTTGKGGLSKVAGALGDVSAIVQFAQSHNATVTPLKSAIVNGVSSTGTQIVAKLSHNGGSSTVTATLWADSSDRLVQANVAASGALKAGTVGVNATVNFTDYGGPVTITAPPASEVRAIPISTVEAFLGKFHLGGRHL